MKRTISFILVLVLSLSLMVPAMAATVPQYTNEAEVLYDLGLFKGTGTNADGKPIFALEQKATRIQGLVMLVRLLGKEAEALAYTGECPFTDVPAWAECYAAYAYANGITKGTSATTFSAEEPLLGKAYVTFALRALGYDDAAGDFSYDDALTKGAELGLMKAGTCTGNIYRDDCAFISYNALKTKMKGSNTTLAEKLVKDGVLTKDAVQKLNTAGAESSDTTEPQDNGTIYGTVDIPYNVSDGTISYEDILKAIPNAADVGGAGFVIREEFARPSTNVNDYSLLSILLSNHHLQEKINKNSSLAINGSLNPQKYYRTHLQNTIHFVSVLDKNCNMIAYCIIPPYYTSSTITFTTCFYDGKDEIEAIKDKTRSFEKYVTKLDKNLFQYEQRGELAYLCFDKDEVENRIGEVAYYALSHKNNESSNKYGGAWRHIENNILRDKGYADFYSIDTGTNYEFYSWDDGVLLLYNKDKETIGYVDYSGGLEAVN